jgi:hypothetical protein
VIPFTSPGLAVQPIGKANLTKYVLANLSRLRTLIAAGRGLADQGVSRISHHHTTHARPLAMSAPAGTLAAFLAIAVVACGSSSPHASAAAVPGTAVHQDCTALAGVLADGPDPDADPAGYAQAQILPLRQLKIADTALHHDVLTLANAYQGFSTSGARGTVAAQQVTKAENAVNSICPQAAP